MKPIFSVILLSAIICTTFAQNFGNQHLLAQSNNRFAQSLYRVLSNKDGNILFSPLSIHLALSMSYQGAGGVTAEDLARTLHLPQAKSAALGYKQILQSLNTVPNVTLSLANKIYMSTGQTLSRSFKSVITQQFESDVQQLDFNENADAADIINQWVNKQTRGNIDKLVDKDNFDSFTRLVLVNAMYFKGKWAQKLYPGGRETFHVNEREQIPVEMMRISGFFNLKYVDGLKAVVLEMPYLNKDFSMVFILPYKRDGLRIVEEKLNTIDLARVTEGMYWEQVDVYLPKFKIEQSLTLKDDLTRLGLGNIFDKDLANFKDMIELRPGESLYVSDVIHKAVLEVTEEGTEATASSGVIHAIPISLPTQFNADHPFVYFLRKVSTNEILFYGRLMRPQ